ncbi:MAG: type sorting protein [Flavisolibacter sp.]|jgi:gliding motility-associated-like protein|nr:type sorting protein [Flavisolibacter sp.]
MKKILLLITVVFCSVLSFAAHITGGEVYYTLVSQSGDDYTYQVTVKLYRDCFSTGAQLDPTVPISIFSNATNTSVWTRIIPQSQAVKQNLASPSSCIQNPPTVCYDVGFYTFLVTLPASSAGYTISYQRCCRIAGINNLNGSSSLGATYTATIPGTTSLATAPANNSAKFIGVDTVIVCADNSFCYNFGATDADGDVLTYAFCNAYVGGSQGTPAPNPPANPPYSSVSYAGPYSANQPLGSGVTLNPATGMMCGIAPPPGIYVVTVCVTEYRNGVPIATQRKDLQIKVGDCNIADASLKPEYINCGTTFDYTFSNESAPNPLVHTYYWEFSDGFTSTLQSPTHTFGDTGIYSFKLVINRGEECSDSVTSIIKVYPGFFPGFTSAGVCVDKPTQFTDTTKSRYGIVNSWRWDFGDVAVQSDTSRAQNPAYTYPAPGTKNVTLIATCTKGCIDTVQQTVDIVTKPPLSVAFKDTLICNGDSVQMHAIGNGVFSWTPVANIFNETTADATVHPTTTTNYFVRLDDQGCIANDTVQIRVVDFVTLRAIPDTTICATDTLRLGATSDGLRFLWNNAPTLNNPTLLRPTAKPVANVTQYIITATIGSCNATDDVQVTSKPYPIADAGNDTIVCYNTAAQLNGSIVGSSFTWSPVTTLFNSNTLLPRASPRRTTSYILSAFDTLGCPKSGRDTVIVIVNPEVVAFAGRDTAVVIGQPLQFGATGGVSYLWSPPIALNNINIADPRAIYNGELDSVRYTLTVKDSIGCSDEATVLVKVFRTVPKVFVPTAFTPNGDGRNEIVAPVAVGITKIEYFRIYNRWGQLVFQTTVNGKGWDGRIGGKDQSTATYVWIVKGTDFTGKSVFAKGNVTLIR